MCSPGSFWGRLGRQGAPNKGPMSEKLVRWTHPGLEFGVFLGPFLQLCSIKNASINLLIFQSILCWIWSNVCLSFFLNLDWFSAYVFRWVFDTILYGFGDLSRRSEPSFLQYLPCEIKVFEIRPSRKSKANSAQFWLKNPSKNQQKSVKNRSQKQVRN